VQAPDRVTEAAARGRVLRPARGHAPFADRGEWTALQFAWRICAHVKSNTVIFTGPDATLAWAPAR
jgi:AICAR transformylase/IMP cyclohydrolase PurH